MEFTIHVKTIPHNEQRYPTVGDYWLEEDEHVPRFEMRVSETGSILYDLMIAEHELVEMLTYYAAHPQETWPARMKANDGFDLKFEADRKPGEDPYTEPGYDKNAPYFNEHMLGCIVEHYLAAMFNVDYNEYDKVTQALYETRPDMIAFEEQAAIEQRTDGTKVSDR